MWIVALLLVGLPAAYTIWAARRLLRAMATGDPSAPPRPRLFQPLTIVPFEARGRKGEATSGFDDRGDAYCAARVDMRGHSPGALLIHRAGVLNRIDRAFGDQDIQIGDRHFDRTYVIKANPEELAHRLFSVERRAEVMAAVRRYEPVFIKVELAREMLEVREWGFDVASPADIDSSIRTASDFVGFILDLEAGSGVLWLGETESGVGQCQVCGTEMREACVECAKCRTPHHEECWRYLGMCSTFACKERDYLADGHRITAPPPPRPEEPSARRQAPGERLQESLRRFEQRQREREGA